jgi:hypothetical protein
MSGYVKRDDLSPRDCGWPGPRSDGGWRYHCFRPVGHDGPHEAMAAEGESIPQTAAGTVRWEHPPDASTPHPKARR